MIETISAGVALEGMVKFPAWSFPSAPTAATAWLNSCLLLTSPAPIRMSAILSPVAPDGMETVTFAGAADSDPLPPEPPDPFALLWPGWPV